MQENQEGGINRQIQGTGVFYSIGKMRKRLFFHSFLSFFFLCVHVWNPSFLMLGFYCSQRISKYYQPLSFILSHLDTGDFQSLTSEILYCLSFQFCVHLKNKHKAQESTIFPCQSPATENCAAQGWLSKVWSKLWICLVPMADPILLVSRFLILPGTKGPIVWEVWVWSHPNFESD